MTRPQDIPVTPAVRHLRAAGIDFECVTYRYEARGGTRVSARELGVDEHTVIKTLIMETEAGDPLIVLMHGDREVSTKQLARRLGVKTVRPCAPPVAQRFSGYLVGGTSPFGTRRAMPVYAESTLFDLETIHINAGKRGVLVRMRPADLERVLAVTRIQVGLSR